MNMLKEFGPLRWTRPFHAHVNWKGGGGGSNETIESIPDWYKPYVTKAAGEATSAFDRGDLSKVVGFTGDQLSGMEGMRNAADMQQDIYNTGSFGQNQLSEIAAGNEIVPASTGATNALKSGAIADAQRAWAPAGSSLAAKGQVGGARAGFMANDRDAQLANQLAGIDYQDLNARRSAAATASQGLVGNVGSLQTGATTGSGTMMELGATQQDQSQREQDSAYQGLSRLGGLLSGAPVPGQTQKQQSGGK